MRTMLKLWDFLRETIRIPISYADPLTRPLDPDEPRPAYFPDPDKLKEAPKNAIIAKQLHSLRPSVSEDEFVKQLRNPIASRMIAVWVEVFVPALNKTLIFDTRVDNPDGMPPSIAQIPPDSDVYPWPAPATEKQAVTATPKGHGGSSCPGYFTRSVFIRDVVYPTEITDDGPLGGTLGGGLKTDDWLEIPVEVLAFHCEGESDDCKYSIAMFSEVLGRLTTKVDTYKADLNMWGKMLITIRPHRPEEYRGHEVIQLVSSDYVKQTGTITGFPPHGAGEFVESSGDELYIGLNPGQRHISAIVKRGRIIFSTDEDDFLQARTRITHFTLVDKHGEPIEMVGSPPYDPSIIPRIAGVRMHWQDIRAGHPEVTHYLVYRVDPDNPKSFEFLSHSQTNSYLDPEYRGRTSLAYAIVPAFHDNTGYEVQGVSLDTAMIMAIEPDPSAFKHRNHGVGHVRSMG